jgi:ribose-phosphate pyrophosphokinase
MISHSGADRIFAIDLHAGQIQGFFDIPRPPARSTAHRRLSARQRICGKGVTVVSPDVGGVERATILAENCRPNWRLSLSVARNPAKSKWWKSSVKSRANLRVDRRQIDSGGTFVAAAQELVGAAPRAF